MFDSQFPLCFSSLVRGSASLVLFLIVWSSTCIAKGGFLHVQIPQKAIVLHTNTPTYCDILTFRTNQLAPLKRICKTPYKGVVSNSGEIHQDNLVEQLSKRFPYYTFHFSGDNPAIAYQIEYLPKMSLVNLQTKILQHLHHIRVASSYEEIEILSPPLHHKKWPVKNSKVLTVSNTNFLKNKKMRTLWVTFWDERSQRKSKLALRVKLVSKTNTAHLHARSFIGQKKPVLNNYLHALLMEEHVSSHQEHKPDTTKSYQATSVKKPSRFSRGRHCKVVLNNGNIRYEKQARLLQSGSAGDRVKIQFIDSKKDAYALLTHTHCTINMVKTL